MDDAMFSEIVERRSDEAEEGHPPVTWSVVVPVSARVDNLRDLYVEFARELSRSQRPFEFIFVLDGPRQAETQALTALKKEFPSVRVYGLNRYLGEATALAAGFSQARGSAIVTLPSYFQVVPNEIHHVLVALGEGDTDLVVTRRFPRIDSLFNQCQGKAFHWLVSALTGTNYQDMSCGLRAMKRGVIDEVQLYGDLHRFLPLLAFQRGFKVVEIPVQQHRLDTKRRIQSPGDYVRRVIDILTLFFLFKFLRKPLRFFGLVGASLFVGGGLITGYLGLYRILGFGGIADRPLLVLGVLLIVLGIQLFSIGLLGEIIIFAHVRNTKEYQVREVLE